MLTDDNFQWWINFSAEEGGSFLPLALLNENKHPTGEELSEVQGMPVYTLQYKSWGKSQAILKILL